MGNSLFNGIDVNIAMTLVSNYAQNHLTAIEDDTNLASLRQQEATSDSRSVWFSLDTLNSFINAIQMNAAQNCNMPNSNLGIRMYFGEYPAADSELWGTNALPAGAPLHLDNYAGMHTLVLVPTYNNGLTNVDFDPKFAHPDGSPMPMSAVCNILSSAEQQMGMGTVNTAAITMLNHGSLAPPPFGVTGNTFGAATGATFMEVVDSL